ncbi:hypothetical protein APS56_06985 [Pseudalgibacter alginicilyticus]|uniref:PIN domain-containing protein n=1 Tax=Pseudalgibacter alginicilyticus TaxID=1736674 RepID=A0A0P0CKD0_9FLAO|nr:hypothetical protein APS56_06985 [Pseudalgibacter alginicilyticus]|tara:strand:- start:7747 stop:8181 length:435 start_codon:yes stop_codon:yes gene_type:complete
MFFFYDIEYLCWLNSLKQLDLIEEDGLKILVPEMHLQNYGLAIRMQIQAISNRKVLDIVDCDGFYDFLTQYDLLDSIYGKGFLFLLHCAKQKNGIVIIGDDRKSQLQLCSNLEINTLSIAEFSSNVIRNKDYLVFINKIRSEML